MAAATLWQHNKGVFDKVNIFIYDEVDKACKKRAENMHGALRYRRILKGERSTTRFPLGDDSKKRTVGRENEPHAYTGWKVKPGTKPLHYNVQNDHVNAVDGYPYTQNLLYGHGWNVSGKNVTRLVPGEGGRWFSTQMPNGIMPWMGRQKVLLRTQIELIAEIWNNKMTSTR